MRKILFILVTLTAFAAMPAYAATVSLAPTTVSVTKGGTFSIKVSADGAGTKIYTVKASISYPASKLEVTGFKLDPAWPLTPPGNLIDNTNGKLIQTGGFIGGFSDTKTFGTITFKAKDSGSATISVLSDSALYNAQSSNVISGSQGASIVAIATPMPVPVVPKVTQPAPTIQTEKEVITAQEHSTSSQLTESQSSLAAVGNAITLGTGSTFVGILFLIVLIFAGYSVYKAVQRIRSK